MSWYLIVLIFLVVLGAVTLAFQIYKMTELDAQCRGLKHPRLWGLFSLSGEGSGGLLLYLIGRRKYPSNMGPTEQLVMESRKKKAGASLVLLAAATIGLFSVCILTL